MIKQAVICWDRLPLRTRRGHKGVPLVKLAAMGLIDRNYNEIVIKSGIVRPLEQNCMLLNTYFNILRYQVIGVEMHAIPMFMAYFNIT